MTTTDDAADTTAPVVPAEEFEFHLDTARRALADAVAGDRPFIPLVILYRGGLLRAMVVPPVGGAGGVFAFTAQTAAALFRADAVLLIGDTYHATGDLSPHTGKPWTDGEMEELALHHDGLAKGWVTEALSACLVTRDSVAFTMLPYTRRGTRVDWGERQDSGDNSVDGRMTRVFDRPEGMPDVTGLDDTDAAALLLTTRATVLLTEYDDGEDDGEES